MGATRPEPRRITVRRCCHRRADLSASGRRFHDRHALSFRAGHSPRGRQAGPSRSRRQSGRPLAHLRLCRSGGSRRAQLRLSAACAIFLPKQQASPVRKYTSPGEDIDSVIDVRAIFQQGHRELAIEAMPALLLPRKGRYGLCDYEKMFCADLRSGHDIFTMRGIDRAARLHGGRATGPIRRARPSARRICAARGLLRWLHDATGLISLPQLALPHRVPR